LKKKQRRQTPEQKVRRHNDGTKKKEIESFGSVLKKIISRGKSVRKGYDRVFLKKTMEDLIIRLFTSTKGSFSS